MTFWNKRDLRAPPLCEMKTQLTDKEKDTILRARKLFADETSAKSLNAHFETLTNEHYILSRFIYKIKNQFRREKSLSSFQRINTCLKRLKELDYIKVIENLKDCLDIEKALDIWEDHLYVISRQTIEYHLVRLMGLSALLAQTGYYCCSTFEHVTKHLNVGHLLSQNVILLAASSRIWYITKSLCLKVCDWYKAVYDCLPCLPLTQVSWLPPNEELPNNLITWLSQNGYWHSDSKIESEMTTMASKPPEASDSAFLTEDIGESLARSHIISNLSRQTAVQSDPQKMDIDEKVVDTQDKPNKQAVDDTKPLDSTGIENEKQSPVVQSVTDSDIDAFLQDAFKTFKGIKKFEECLKSKVLDVNGVSLSINRVKREKMNSIVKVTLDSIPPDLKKERKRKIFMKVAVPELRKVLKRIVSSNK